MELNQPIKSNYFLIGIRLVYGAGYWHKGIDPAEEECMQQEEKREEICDL